jgi:hypothetical protein
MTKRHIETINHSRSIGHSVDISHCEMSDAPPSESYSVPHDPVHDYYLLINTMAAQLLDLDALAETIGLSRHDGEDNHDLASRCHYRIDDLMRQHALQVRALRIVELMDLHDAIERLVP